MSVQVETTTPFATIDEAIQDIREGKLVVVVDAADRENEGDLTIAAQFASSSARLTTSAPSGRPSEADMPRLVVASASKPSAASSFAVPASHGFGMMNAPGRA